MGKHLSSLKKLYLSPNFFPINYFLISIRLLNYSGGCGEMECRKFDLNQMPAPEVGEEVDMAGDLGGASCVMESMEDVAFHLGLPSSFHSEPFIDLGNEEDTLDRCPCPHGKPLSSRLPSYLRGNVLQVWELIWRFHEELGLGQTFSLSELESELVSPWSGSYPLDCAHETAVDIRCASSSKGEELPQAKAASLDKCTGLILTKTLSTLLKLLVGDLLSKVVAYPSELNSRRGKRKDLDCLAYIKKPDLERLLPINELTWNEIARRYLLALLSFEGNERGKVINYLFKGDGSLTSIAALERDSLVLADTLKDIYSSIIKKNEIITICERQPNDGDSEKDNGVIIPEIPEIPKWVLALEPIRKLPTNVGSRLRKCIEEALEKNPPQFAKERLLYSVSREVYKANAAGPTKRIVISVLDEVSSGEDLHAGNAEKVEARTTLHGLISKQCQIVLRAAVAAAVIDPSLLLSRPFNLRKIDLRLAAGVYNGSHEAFADDVREVWRNIRTASANRSDLIEKISKQFDDMYGNEVLTFVRKIDELSDDNGSNGDALREREDLLAHVSNISIPRAPWEDGLCKVCGVDKDDKKVLLCDTCNSEYHTYCLNPPIVRIPKGNWYCPSCIAGQSCSTAAYRSVKSRKRKFQGEITSNYLESIAHLANLIYSKGYSKFSVEERVSLITFLFDEALNTDAIRDHMEQSASLADDLQQKLGSLTSELKRLKFKEEISVVKTSCSHEAINNEISAVEASIISTESELSKVSLRKDLLGRDSNGRVYWSFQSPGAHPRIVANGSLVCKHRSSEEFMTIPESDIWMVYESEDEIRRLVRWLGDEDIREKELKETILQVQVNHSTCKEHCFSSHQSFSNCENSTEQLKMITESPSRVLVQKDPETLEFLKMKLLNINTALPNDALRQSRSSQDRRNIWRAFVQSAKSVYEMTQATITLEDSIKTEYLQSNWQYWSSPSTAVKLTSLSALALHIYSLDSAIFYQKPSTIET